MPDRIRTKAAKTAASAPAPVAPVRAPATRRRASSRSRAATVGGASAPEASRHEMIALVAYYRAQSRGFAPGGEFEDWIAAEAEVDGRLARGGNVVP